MIMQRIEETETKENVKVKTPSDLVPLLRELYKTNGEKENFVVVVLKKNLEVISMRVVSVGTLDKTIIHPRDVFRFAILENAAAIIVSHNHPSGSVEPSKDDKEATKRLKEAADIIGIQLLDHIIVTEKSFYSFSESDFDF